jgi:hypothetical protein
VAGRLKLQDPSELIEMPGVIMASSTAAAGSLDEAALNVEPHRPAAQSRRCGQFSDAQERVGHERNI